MRFVVCFFILIYFYRVCLAAPVEAGVGGNEPAAPDHLFEVTDDHAEVNDYTSIEFFDWSQAVASDYVESLNDRVDSFFMGAFFDEESVEDESSGSNGRLFFSSRREDGVDPDYRVGLNLRLVLPRTRDRFKLLLETDEDEDNDKETNVLGTTENVTYSTAIRVEVDKGQNWNTSFDNGIRWSGEPVFFSRVRARRTDYFDSWKTRLVQTVSWRTDEEWGSRFSASALRPLDIEHHFRMGFNADYLLSDDYANLDTSFSIFHELSSRSALLLDLSFFGDTQDYSKVSDTVLSLSYRRKVFSQHLFVEVVPELAWPRENEYELTPAITLLFEMILGVNN
ncbi:hypothetical protein NBRC116188_17750 [Oceaniserpentilla sp. 4NH20-0058]|uniref:hypothetical protein n=1 Tax=Oceaniserpentilla sp. 4NH20-0058 TaxID=3127660 RepID=UPI003106F0E6